MFEIDITNNMFDENLMAHFKLVALFVFVVIYYWTPMIEATPDIGSCW